MPKAPSNPILPVPAKGKVTLQPSIAPAAKKGVPLERHGTTSGSPGKMASYANRWRENYNPLRQFNIAIAVSLLERGQRGDYALLQWTFRFIERRYPTLSALISRCEAPLQNFDWQIKTKTDLPPGATEAMAEGQKETLKNAYDGIDNLSDAIKFLALADFRGYSHLQKHYSPDGDVVHLETLHQWCIARDGLYGDWFWNPDSRSMTMPALVVGEANRIGGDQLPLEDFIIRTVERPVDEIALINFVRSNLCEKDWDGFIEIYGIPGGVVIMPGNVPPGKESEYENAAQRVAEGGSGAIPNGSDYKPNDGPRGVDPFTPRLKHLDEQLIMVGTGGKLTMLAESGTGTLAGGAHEDTFQEIAESRAREVSECFQRQFDAAILMREHPGQPALVYFELSAKDEVDVSALVKDIVALGTVAIKADTEWLSEQTGYELEDAPPEPAPDPGGGGDSDPVFDPDKDIVAQRELWREERRASGATVKNRWVTINGNPIFIDDNDSTAGGKNDIINPENERTSAHPAGSGGAPGSLDSAANDTGRGAHAVPGHDASLAERRARISAEQARLRQWAADHGKLGGTLPREDTRGGEHTVQFDEKRQRVIKATRPGAGTGYGIAYGTNSQGATPSEYLDRLAVHNRLFSDAVKVERIVPAGGKLSIVTSQPMIKGREASQPEIDALMRSKGFEKIGEGTFHHAGEGLLVHDLVPKNARVGAQGRVQPIDPAIQRVTPEFAADLQAHPVYPVRNRADNSPVKPVAAALANDLAPVLARLQAISEISDDEIFLLKLRQFHADFPQLKTDILKDPSADRALLPIITQAFVRGLAGRNP